MLDEEDLACCYTTEDAKNALENIEQQLATRFFLTGSVEEIRNKIIELDQSNFLIEDEVVAEWHSAYATYLMCLNEA